MFRERDNAAKSFPSPQSPLQGRTYEQAESSGRFTITWFSRGGTRPDSPSSFYICLIQILATYLPAPPDLNPALTPICWSHERQDTKVHEKEGREPTSLHHEAGMNPLWFPMTLLCLVA